MQLLRTIPRLVVDVATAAAKLLPRLDFLTSSSVAAADFLGIAHLSAKPKAGLKVTLNTAKRSRALLKATR